MFLENYEYSIFDLVDDNRTSIEVISNNMSGRFISGNSPLELIEEYTKFAGRMPELPDWLGNGAMVGIQGGTKFVHQQVKKLVDHDVPISSLWIQDWVGQRSTPYGTRLWWNWEVDRTSYPDWEDLVLNYNLRDVRILGYVNPFLVDVAKKENYRRNLFEEAKELGYLVRDEKGKVVHTGSGGFHAYMVDLSYPKANRWLKNIIKEKIVSNGMVGWMADFGEALSFSTILHDGTSGRRYHNRYPEEWARLNREVLEETGLVGEAVFFTRAGFTRSPRYSTLFWLGDQLVSWDHHDGIKTAVIGMLSSGFSGYSLNSSDIGGCIAIDNALIKYKRSKELLLRWMELAAFTVMYRSHEGNDPETGGYQIYSDDDTMNGFARFAKVYKALHEYRKVYIKEAHEKGYPLARHMYLEFPADPNVLDIDLQYMLGSEILVAPVLDPEITTAKVYIPRGKWVHIWSDKVFGHEDKGVWAMIEAPLGRPPVFYKKGSELGADFVRKLDEMRLRK
jgi:alpha-glucosidase